MTCGIIVVMTYTDIEKRKEWQREYYAKNRDRIREREREYYKNGWGEKRNLLRRGKPGGKTGRKTGEHISKDAIVADKNGRWKGGWSTNEYYFDNEKPKYKYLHLWLSKVFGQPDTCEFCGKTGLSGKKIGWANKSREYKPEREDWLRLCRSCHAKYDFIEGKVKRRKGKWIKTINK